MASTGLHPRVPEDLGDGGAYAPRRRPSISDVALRAGVSRAAVSKVIRNAYGVSTDMRTRVDRAIEELGYRPRVAARAMRGRSFTIGFEIPNLDNDFFNQVVDGAAGRLAASGYQLVVAPVLGYVQPDAVLDALVDRQVDGIISVSCQIAPAWLEELAGQVALVLLGRHGTAAGYDTVTGDDVAGAHLVMDHLMSLGHRRITHLTIAPFDGSPHALRAATYRERMGRAGYQPDLVHCEPHERDAYEAIRPVLARPERPTAVFAGHDTLAIGALRAVAELGLAAEVSVVGYDDIGLASHPLVSLTTVDQGGVNMGATAVTLLLERIQQHRTEARHHQVTPRLRVRGSSRPAPAAVR